MSSMMKHECEAVCFITEVSRASLKMCNNRFKVRRDEEIGWDKRYTKKENQELQIKMENSKDPKD